MQKQKQMQLIESKEYPPNAFKRQKKHVFEQVGSSQQIKDERSKRKSSQHQIDKISNNMSISQDKINQPINQQDEQSEQSQHLQLQKQAQDIVNQIKNNEQMRRANDKVVVGTGFSFDITEFFKFQKKKKLDSKQGDIFSEISGSMIAWIILLYSVLNSAMIPSWIMNIKATKLLRISWRFLLQSIMIFPFVLYERRSGNQQVKRQYSFSHIIKPVHLKKVYLSAVATSIWFTTILSVFEWTYISHGMVLGSLSNFFLSIHRAFTKSQHQLQPGGRYCVILGILLVIYDSYRLHPQAATDAQKHVINPFYLTRQWYQRVIADLIALFVSFTMSKFSRYTADMKSHYPPYLSMLLVNFFMFINMAFSTYFFNGLTFDSDPRFGFFSIFSQAHFAAFMYMSIVLCFGMFVSFVLISKLFQDPILPALAMTLDPILATMLLEWFGVQTMPKAYSFMGYLLIVPGLLLILVGQCLYQRSQTKQDDQKSLQQSAQIIKQLRQLRQLKSLEQKKIKVRKLRSIKKDIDQQHLSRLIRSDDNIQLSQSPTTPKISLYQPLIQREHKLSSANRKASLNHDDLKNYDKL